MPLFLCGEKTLEDMAQGSAVILQPLSETESMSSDARGGRAR